MIPRRFRERLNRPPCNAEWELYRLRSIFHVAAFKAGLECDTATIEREVDAIFDEIDRKKVRRP